MVSHEHDVKALFTVCECLRSPVGRPPGSRVDWYISEGVKLPGEGHQDSTVIGVC